MARSIVGLVLVALVVTAPDALMSRSNALNDVGVCLGLVADNLPAPSDIVNLFNRYQIGKMRLFEPRPEILNALRGSQIAVTLGVLNGDLHNLAASQDAANMWFATNVEPYLAEVHISYISVGNEVIPGEFAASVAPAMQNLQNVLDAKGITSIKVSTSVAVYVLGKSDPPSAGEFTDAASPTMTDVLKFLTARQSPLMINVYTYYGYAPDPEHIRQDYALLTTDDAVVIDGSLSYSNMFDAIVDAIISAMEKVGGGGVNVMVTESGWPSAGNGNITTPDIAGTYNRNFVKKILSKAGTPKRPNMAMEGFVFAMFNEDLKPAGIEQNFGLFYPNMQPVYNLF